MMARAASRKRRKPSIGPRRLFGLLTVTAAILLTGGAMWPYAPDPTVRLFIRSLCGLFAGLVLGLLVEILFFWPHDPDLDPKHFILHVGRSRLPVIGPGIACATCAFVAAIAGGFEIKGLVKHVIVGVLVGVVVGSVVIGGFVFPAIAVALKDPAYPTKAHASYQLAGMLRGVPMGALVGFAAGLGYNCYSRSPRRHAQAKNPRA